MGKAIRAEIKKENFMKLQFIKELIKNSRGHLSPPKHMHQLQLLRFCLQPLQEKMNYATEGLGA